MANILGTPENDTLNGTDEDDHIRAGAGDDIVYGSFGNDDLFGEAGNDTINGGAGSDLITGGAGEDSLYGGRGNDQFYGLTVGDFVDGGDGGGEDFDRLFLEGLTPVGGRLEITRDTDNAENGTITVFDATGEELGDVTFQNIEKLTGTLPCFTPGTRIATPKGEKVVESLSVGDRVITRDNGIQEILWMGARTLSGAELRHADHLQPVLIQKGALGPDLPERDMTVSPNHRVLVASDKTALYFEEREVLVAAKHLTGLEGVDVVTASEVTYIHIMCAQHEVVLSDGVWTESFQPGDLTLAGIGNAQRLEILELFPELATPEGIADYTPARRTLKKHEAQLLTK